MKPAAATISEHRGIARPAGSARVVSGCGLAARVSGLAVGRLPSDEEFAQHVKIPAQHAQTDIACKSSLRPVAAPLQAVARLEGPDRRFDSRVRLAGRAELDARRPFLLSRLMGSQHRQTGMLDDLGEFLLVLRAVKPAVQRRAADAAAVAFLGLARLADGHVAVGFVPRQDGVVGDEAHAVLVEHHQASELHRMTGFAADVQLGVGLEDAEELFAVGDDFAAEDASPRGAADVPRPLEKRLEFAVQRHRLDVDRACFVQRFAEPVGPRADRDCQFQQLAVGHLEPRWAIVSLAGSDPLDLAVELPRLAVKVLVLPPAVGAEQSGERRRQPKDLRKPSRMRLLSVGKWMLVAATKESPRTVSAAVGSRRCPSWMMA